MKINALPIRNLSPLLAAALFLLGGCARTDYVELGEEKSDLISPLRQVGVKLDPDYIDAFPDCTIVLAPETADGFEFLGPVVEESLARHLSRKMTRVIGPYERETVAYKYSLDLRHEHDQEELADIAGCDTLLNSRVVGSGMTSTVVWSRVEIGIDTLMRRPIDGRVLWRARHTADRSRGGIPSSPLGAVVDTYRSLNFAVDRDIAESVVDDVIRRIVRSIPDSRVLESSSQENDGS
jgi:hypothetical protein